MRFLIESYNLIPFLIHSTKMLDKNRKLRLQSKIFTLFNTVDGKEVLNLLKEDMFTSHDKASDREIFIDEGRRRLVSYFDTIITTTLSKGDN